MNSKQTLASCDKKFVNPTQHNSIQSSLCMISMETKVGQYVDWKNLPLVILYNIFSNLSPADRLRASSTCNTWRDVIYHPSLWPQKHLKVNLCPHKFTLSNQSNKDVDSGFHTFQLHEPLVRKHHFGIYWVPSRKDDQLRRPNRKNFNQQLKSFIQKCSRFLTGITFYFDPNSSYNVMDLIKILKFLSDNEVAIYELSNIRPNVYANCRNLKHFSIIPVTTLVRCVFDERFMSLYYGLTEAIRFLFSKCHSLKHVSLGALHELVYSTDIFCEQFVKNNIHQNIECLHLNSIKGDIFRYLPHKASLECLEKFSSLQHLSIDFDVVNTRTINILLKLKSIKLLTINVHRVNRHHPGISKDAWTRLVNKHVNLSVSINLLHTNCSHLEIVIESLLDTTLPLKQFRAYYLELRGENGQLKLCNMLEILTNRHSNTLESLLIIDNLDSPKGYLKSVSPNVLVMLTWRCRNLKDLTIIGFELTDLDIIAIARLRGEALRNFYFPESCIQMTQSFSHTNFDLNDFCTYFDSAPFSAQRSFKDSVSMPLKRCWQPIASYEVPEIFSTDYVPQLTYHRTILEHTCPCKR